MDAWTRLRAVASRGGRRPAADRLRTDGGDRPDREDRPAEEQEPDSGADESEEAPPDVEESSVDVVESGEAEPAEPRWERIDPDDIPEFEIRADEPVVSGSTGDSSVADDEADPAAGRPNAARSPGQSRIKREGTEGYVAALEICARLPDDVRLPEEAAEVVPAAVEAELEEDIRAFALAEFGTDAPSVETLSFDEVDGEIWMRLRLGITPEAFTDLDPDEIRTHALQELEGFL
ncbi:hypothetical protein [Natronococcus wangiae]|uniref:hypothetical protein n=1 Tax=Natronococcus wangiae TaxID=3068275 RepID=UPI00273E7966|nr:hypothetical protein [Natronococcus sp. AD5]